MVLTTIKRTQQTIAGFNYSGIVYKHVVEHGQTSGGWTRDMTRGGTAAAPEQVPERIYWSDAANGHTYIGYSIPQGSFDWYQETTAGGVTTYFGSLGDPTIAPNPTTGYIDHTDSTKIASDDLLLTYDTNKVAETGGSVAKLYFHHALANVRVIVNIQGFSANTDAADSKSVVSGMVLKNMLTLYKWNQMSHSAEPLVSTDPVSLYGGGVAFDQKKDVHMWIPRPAGTGTGVGKQFTFYGLAVPTTLDANSLKFQFTVTYPDPMNPEQNVNKVYLATMEQAVVFRAGYCTTINISLNHSNEKMTIGAEYMDWQYIETPNEGELRKDDNFLTTTERTSVTIAGDAKATVDDATWLYWDEQVGHPRALLDIYGNNGTEAHPYLISNAAQLLSFAYEVKGGRSFAGQYITLDSDIYLQKSLSDSSIVWIGIGDEGHPFDGVFNGGYRHINCLQGAPIFHTIGGNGIVDHLFISNTIGITGRGSIAEVNNGVICGAFIEGDVVANNTGAYANSYCGSIVGENHSMLISCSHIGDIKGTNYESVGALLGYNDGIVAICYKAGDVQGDGVGEYAGIGKYTPRSIAYCCYFNSDLYHGHDYADLNARIGHVAYPLTTAMMQSNMYVNKPANMSGDLGPEDEIINDGIPGKNDPFFFHLSLNYGIKRAVAMLKVAVQQTPDAEGNITIHAASAPGDPNPFAVLKLKKTLVEWLINHYGGELELTHQFRYTPGAYPSLQ